MKLGTKKLNTILIIIAIVMFLCIMVMTLMLFAEKRKDDNELGEVNDSDTVEINLTSEPNNEDSRNSIEIESILGYERFYITFDDSWIYRKTEYSGVQNEYVVEQNGYAIKIVQRQGEFERCIYHGNADGPFDLDLTTYTYKTLSPGFQEIRRSQSEADTFILCGFDNSSAEYNAVTNIGTIEYIVPNDFDYQVILQMDNIIENITVN